MLAEKLGRKVTQIFITPLEGAIPYCKRDSYVVMGTKDEEYSIYKKHCDDNGIKALFIKDADHSLEVAEEPYQSIDILKDVMRYISDMYDESYSKSNWNKEE